MGTVLTSPFPHLTKEECNVLDWGTDENYIDYSSLYRSKFQALRLAYSRVNVIEDAGFLAFLLSNYDWLPDYALFMAIKEAHGGKCWLSWEKELRLRHTDALEECRKKYTEEILFYEYIQYLFEKQWKALKTYANQAGIQMIGDIPIYVALDSADVWANPELFQLDEEGRPTFVAGCPPDAFSETGQLWGNPLYAWEKHRDTGYDWWIRRMAFSFLRYDIVRIDHFRGFEAYYSIPADAVDATAGAWEKGPGMELFDALKRVTKPGTVIAEDLGLLTPKVYELLKASGYPGMKVFQFGFYEGSDSAYLPHNHIENCVVYTGTHDNQTTLGWYQDLSAEDKAFLEAYTGIRSWKQACPEMIKLAMKSIADTCIIPVQDYLELDDKARLNEPGTLGNNWKWRMSGETVKEYPVLAQRILAWTQMFGR